MKDRQQIKGRNSISSHDNCICKHQIGKFKRNRKKEKLSSMPQNNVVFLLINNESFFYTGFQPNNKK